ncbi:MAG: hypothetical protein DHS20C15_27910 [Planctomycetota bacterium]|nr:MAG: hypothetical protein DHS20C15_27910 [Planctomycetota bacterium]
MRETVQHVATQEGGEGEAQGQDAAECVGGQHLVTGDTPRHETVKGQPRDIPGATPRYQRSILAQRRRVRQ